MIVFGLTGSVGVGKTETSNFLKEIKFRFLIVIMK